MSNLHQKAIEGVCAEALMRVSPKARVKILRRLLKVAIEDAKQPPAPDPRQMDIMEVLDGTSQTVIPEELTAGLRQPGLSAVCLRGPILPPGQLRFIDDAELTELAGAGFIPA